MRTTLLQLGVPTNTFCDWYRRYLDVGVDGLEDRKPTRRRYDDVD